MVVVTVIRNLTTEPISAGQRMAIYERSKTAGGIHPELDPLLRDEARECLLEKRSRLRSYRLGSAGPERTRLDHGEIDIFFEVLARPPRLIIVGCGHIAVPLARVAGLLEFEIVVIDDRPEFANRERFPNAREIHVGPYQSTLTGVPVDGDTYIVLVTRGHVHDQACLEVVLDAGVAYIGMIGSRRRVRTVLEHAEARGHDVDLLRRVHAPIGLDISAQTPAEIAVAVMAEIIKVRRGGRAASLSVGEAVHAR